MATVKQITVPDIGNASDVDVIEVMIKPGDKIEKEDPLITLETDKATMEIPSSEAGIVDSVNVKVGDTVSQGQLIAVVKAELESEEVPDAAEPQQAAEPIISSSEVSETVINVTIPDIGSTADVDVIEILVSPGDHIEKDASIITLEGDKATMEVPAPQAGEVQDINVKVGDKVSQGSLVLTLKTKVAAGDKPAPVSEVQETAAPAPAAPTDAPSAAPQAPATQTHSGQVHAGPAVRRLGRELGVTLEQVIGTGRKGRVTKQDLQSYVKTRLANGGSGLAVEAMPEIDFSQFGEIETQPLKKIKRLTGKHVHRSWVTVPHVTQFDEADITELEDFRKANKAKAEKQGFKLTPLVFIMKAVVAALKAFPQFNSSLSANGENLILKHYYHIGVAADTPNGLVVPVIRNADQKGIFEIAKELGEVSARAREKGLMPQDMQGGCFTISSLGGISGTAFTPIVNSPDVAILGVSKAKLQPVYQEGEFVPRLILPLSLSYDHRVIDGAEAARFTKFLGECLNDIRNLLL